MKELREECEIREATGAIKRVKEYVREIIVKPTMAHHVLNVK